MLLTTRRLGDDLLLVTGRRQILDLAPLLQQLARRTGQPGAMHWLEYFLFTPSFAGKPPYLLLQLSREAHPRLLSDRDIAAAALFFEYRIAGWRTRVFSTDDAVGFRTVIAPAAERARFAERAANALLGFGAHIVLATFEAGEGGTAASPVAATLRGSRQRSVGRILPLATTYDETLAQLGRLTRRNLRYYRRRLESRLNFEFVADARPKLSFGVLRALDMQSRNPVHSERELRLRWRACGLPGSFLVGLRTAAGDWISLMSGWRDGETTVLHWQLNASGCEQDSISTVMRSYFLEHEIANGARRLLMFGGTPHSIRHSFSDDAITDLVMCRDSVRSRLIRSVVSRLLAGWSLVHRNHVLSTLLALELQPGPQQAHASPASRSSHPNPAAG